MSKKNQNNDVVEDISFEEISESNSTEIILRDESIKKEVEDRGIIDHELNRFELQVKEIQDALETIKFNTIEDDEDRLKAINLKITSMMKLGPLLAVLEDLRTKSKVKSENIKGSRNLSPLEDGTLDD